MRSRDWSNKASCTYGIHIIADYITPKRYWKVCFCTSWSQTILALGETKQERVWFIHLLGHIRMAAMSYSLCWGHSGFAPEWSSIVHLFSTRGLLGFIQGGLGAGCSEGRGAGKPLPCKWHLTLLYCGWLSLQICREETLSYGRAAIPAAHVWINRVLQPILSVQCLS